MNASEEAEESEGQVLVDTTASSFEPQDESIQAPSELTLSELLQAPPDTSFSESIQTPPEGNLIEPSTVKQQRTTTRSRARRPRYELAPRVTNNDAPRRNEISADIDPANSISEPRTRRRRYNNASVSLKFHSSNINSLWKLP